MTSKERILKAAISVFARKGRHGARMEEIASLAQINKAMIYYFFHSKDDLYFEVLKLVHSETTMSLSGITVRAIESGQGYEYVLRNFISAMISYFSENTYYTRILIESMTSGSEEISQSIKELKDCIPDRSGTERFKEFFEKGKSEGIIRHDVDIVHMVISMIGMSMIYFFSRSITEAMEIEVSDEKYFLEQRRESIIDLVFNSIFINKGNDLENKKTRSKSKNPDNSNRR